MINGTSSLHIALLSSGIRVQDEVLQLSEFKLEFL